MSLELRKMGLSEAQAPVRPLLEPIGGVVYDLWLVNYQLLLSAQPADNYQMRIALSQRGRDLDLSVTALAHQEMAEDPGIFCNWGTFLEKPTDAGIHEYFLTKQFNFPQPFTVPHVTVQHGYTWLSAFDLAIEVYYEARRVDAATSAFYAHRYR